MNCSTNACHPLGGSPRNDAGGAQKRSNNSSIGGVHDSTIKRTLTRLQDAERKAAWWKVARRAAELLHEQFGIQRLAVIGDLVRDAPLNVWSEITLVAWDMPRDHVPVRHALWELSRDPLIDLIDVEWATPAQRESIAHEAVMLD